MVLTPEKFVKTEFGLVIGIIFIILAVLSLMRGSHNAKRSPTGTLGAFMAILMGSYVVARFYGYDI